MKIHFVVSLLAFTLANHAFAEGKNQPKLIPSTSLPKALGTLPPIEHGPFGDTTLRPSASQATDQKEIGFAPVTGPLVEEAAQGFAPQALLAGGRLAYFVYGTLRSITETTPTAAPSATKPAVPIKPTGAKPETSKPFASPATASKPPVQAPLAPRPKHLFLVLREFGTQGETQKQQLFQVHWTFFRPTALFWFPDGKKLLFQADDASRGPNNTALYTWEIGTPYPIAAMVGRPYQRIAISPDGRYVAAAAFGALVDQRWDSQANAQLILHDLQAGKGRDVGKDRVATTLTWTPDNKLLYSLLPSKEAGGFRAGVQGDLFEVDPVAPAETEPRLLGQGMAPRLSPDGKWLAFIGQRDPVGQPTFVLPFACLFERATGKRYVGPDGVRECLWSPDSKRLLLLGQVQVTGAPMLVLRAVQMNAARTEEIASIPLNSDLYLPAGVAAASAVATPVGTPPTTASPTVNPTSTANRPLITPAKTPPTTNGAPPTVQSLRPARWELLDLSKDGQQLRLWIKAWLPPNERGFSEDVWTLQTLNAQNGATASLGTLKAVSAAAFWQG